MEVKDDEPVLSVCDADTLEGESELERDVGGGCDIEPLLVLNLENTDEEREAEIEFGGGWADDNEGEAFPVLVNDM
jgi:hypothetical protein